MTAATAKTSKAPKASKKSARVVRLTFEVRGRAKEAWICKEEELLFAGPAGTGKAQPLDATVWTPSGPMRMGSVFVGQDVLTPHGTAARVVAIYPQGEQQVYRLTFTGGDEVECTADHLWSLRYTGGSKKNGKKVREMSAVLPLSAILDDYLTKCGVRGSRPKYWIPQPAPVAMAPRVVPVDPYVLGALIGDGSLRAGQVSLSSADSFIVEEVARLLGPAYRMTKHGKYDHAIAFVDPAAFRTKSRPAKRGYVSWSTENRKFQARARTPGGGVVHLGLHVTRSLAQAALDNYRGATHRPDELEASGLSADLGRLGLLGKLAHDKFIPELYSRNSVEVRLALVQGLMDTDGTVDSKTGMPCFCTSSRRLADDFKSVIESLGGICTIATKKTTRRDAYICTPRINDNASLFRLERKRVKCKARTKYPVKRMLLKIEPAGVKPCQCIAIESDDGLYLTDHFIVTHNTRVLLERLHLQLCKYPGMRALILRKTQTSLTASALVTYKDEVLHELDGVKYFGGSGQEPPAFKYPNGSVLVVGGMDKADKVLSTQYDAIYCNEANELTEAEWENLSIRCRRGHIPYMQLVADCNPQQPTHWLKARSDRGAMRRFDARFEDNPKFWDLKTGDWTEAGRAYIKRLDALTGVRYLRLRKGLWAAAEGLVYENWNPQVHVIDWFQPPAEWPRYWLADFGFTNPFAWSAWAMNPDGALFMYREIYKTQTLVEDHAKKIAQVTEGEPRPVALICDHDAEDRATLERHLGIKTVAAFKSVSPGIQAVNARLRSAANGKPRLFIMRNALVERDAFLQAEHKPTCGEEEVESYVWPKGVDGKTMKEAPVKENDHQMDCWRYLVCHVDRVGRGLPKFRARSFQG